jgi:BirA family transcriptional regulator, biotin operon repressor / biotin---[acetyl-CoA-carboxylase] ligase
MIGSPRVHHRLTDSTNERARALAALGAPHGTLVTADEQTAGRGRQGREWTAPPRSAVLMSLVLRELEDVLPLAAAVAVCEALAPLECAIKWPNDVWLSRQKLAGILAEGRPAEGWAVLGIGLNVSSHPPDLPATSLRAHGDDRSVEDVLRALVPELDRWLHSAAASVLDAWRSRDALLGRTVRWQEGSGEAAGIDASGALLVDTESGRVALNAGEVHLERS